MTVARPLAVSLSLSLSLCLTGPAGATPQLRVLDDLLDVYPYSLPGDFTSSADGSVLYCGEGGGLAYLHAVDPAGMQVPLDRVPVGSLGAIAADLLLDPGAQVTWPGYQHRDENVLYVAGGRHGLWAMEAAPDPALPKAAVRLDDSGNDSNSLTQQSRCWCTALDVMTLDVEGTPRTFLVALFARRAMNRLRVYPIEDARAALRNPGVPGEFGNELDLSADDVLSIALNSNPAIGPAVPPVPGLPEDYAPTDFAFGTGLAVDDGLGGAFAHVYVSLGMQGLVRVRIQGSDLAPGQPTSPLVEAGPFFGGDSPHAASWPELYGHWTVYEDYDSDGDGIDDAARPIHFERPWFTDVAVQDFGSQHFVLAAVDHLGWVKIDPTNWGAGATLVHHEGRTRTVTVAGSATTRMLTPLAPGGTNLAYARKIEVVELTDTSPSQAGILVTYGIDPWRMWEHVGHDGRLLPFDGSALGKLPDSYREHYRGEVSATLVHRDLGTNLAQGPFTGPDDRRNHVWLEPTGGIQLHVPSPQGSPMVFFSSENRFLDQGAGATTLERFETYRYDFTWGTPPSLSGRIVRAAPDRPGRFTRSVGHALPNPGTGPREEDVLLTAFNDGGFPQGPALGMQGDELVELDPPAGGQATPAPGSLGILFAPEGQWLDGTGNHWMWGTGRPTASALTHFALNRLLFDENAGRPEVGVAAGTFLWSVPEGLPDQIQPSVRGAYYATGHVNEGYDQSIVGFGSAWAEGALFTQFAGERRGVYLLPRSNVQAEANLQPLSGGVVGPLSDIVSYVPLPFLHRELSNLQPGSQAAKDYLKKVGGASAGFFSQLVQVPSPGDPERWVYFVAANFCVLDPDDPDVDPDWITGGVGGEDLTVWADRFSHLMVRLYDVSDPTPGGQLNLPTILGPDPRSAAVDLEVVEFDGEWYLFVADFAGELLVYHLDWLETTDATGAASHADTFHEQPFERWQPKPAVGDALGQNCRGIALDLQGEGTENERLVAYVAFTRQGIQVLEFLPGNSPGSRLDPVTLIQTSYQAEQLELQRYLDGTGAPAQRLFVADERGGLRVYGDRE